MVSSATRHPLTQKAPHAFHVSCRVWDRLLSCWWEHGGMHKGMGPPPAAAACAALLMGMTRSCKRL